MSEMLDSHYWSCGSVSTTLYLPWFGQNHWFPKRQNKPFVICRGNRKKIPIIKSFSAWADSFALLLCSDTSGSGGGEKGETVFPQVANRTWGFWGLREGSWDLLHCGLRTEWITACQHLPISGGGTYSTCVGFALWPFFTMRAATVNWVESLAALWPLIFQASSWDTISCFLSWMDMWASIPWSISISASASFWEKTDM